MKIHPRCAALLSILLWSLGAPFVLGMSLLPSSLLLALSSTITLVSISLILALTGHWKSLIPSMKQVPYYTLLLMGNQVGYILAFRWAPPAQVDLVYYLWPTALFLLNSRDSKFLLRAAVIGAGAGGLALAFNPDSLQLTYLPGYAIAIFGALGWILYQQSIAHSETEFSPYFQCLCAGAGAPFYWIFYLLSSDPFVIPDAQAAACLFLYGGGVLVVAFICWGYATGSGCAREMSALSYMIPLFSILGLCACGYAEFSPRLLISVLLVLSAAAMPVLAHEWSTRRASRKPTPILSKKPAAASI